MPERRDPEAPSQRTIEVRPDMLWPLAIIIALLVMAAVNAAFIYVAITGADDVAPSYYTEDR